MTTSIARGVFAAFAMFGIIMAIYLAADAALRRPGLLRIDAARAATLSADYSEDARNSQPLPPLDPGIVEAAIADAEELRLATSSRDRESAPVADETPGDPPAADEEDAPATQEALPTSEPTASATPLPRSTQTPVPRATETPEPTSTAEPEPTTTPKPNPTATPVRVFTKTPIVCLPDIMEITGCPSTTPSKTAVPEADLPTSP